MDFFDAPDLGRHLVGFEYRLKGRERIEEKVIHHMLKRGVRAERAFDSLTDALRYTFQYSDDKYAVGVLADLERMKAHGFKPVGFRNMWAGPPSAGCKGITGVWRVPDVSGRGQLFEVQFHTPASFTARQETFEGYARLRTLECGNAEVSELRARQRRATARVPVPAGALDLLAGADTHGRRDRGSRGAAMQATYYAIVDDFSTRDLPGGVVRRAESGGPERAEGNGAERAAGDAGEYDEEFGTDLEWTRSWVLYSWERGNMDAQCFEVTEYEANQIIERIRGTVTGQIRREGTGGRAPAAGWPEGSGGSLV